MSADKLFAASENTAGAYRTWGLPLARVQAGGPNDLLMSFNEYCDRGGTDWLAADLHKAVAGS